MASGMAGSYSEENTYLCRSNNISTYVTQQYMHLVFEWGTSTRKSNEDIFDYLERKKGKDKTHIGLKDELRGKQLTLIQSDKTGSTYDVSLLFLCIKYGCDNLASLDDPKWKRSGSSLESLIYSTKEFRNELSHQPKKMNKIEFIQRTDKIKKVLKDMLREAGTVYGKDSSKAVQDMCDEINFFRDSSLVSFNYEKYMNLPLFVEQRGLACQRVKVLLTDRYNELEIFVSPIPRLSHFKFKAKEIYTKMKVRYVVNTLEVIIKYKHILKDHSKDRNYPVILVEAISGMGKTVLMKMIISDWLSDPCVMENLTSIELLLYVECRDSSIDTFQKLLQHLVPDLCQDFMGDDVGKVIKDLNTLVLIDGLDELNSASSKLLDELLYLKWHFGITLLVTSRPDKVPSFYNNVIPRLMTIKHIHLDEIPQVERNNFVDRYQEETRNCGIECQDANDLQQTLQEKEDPLDGFLKNPYNLALTFILWNNDPAKVNVDTTAPELYYHIHQLSKEKLLERLQRRIQNLSYNILQGKIPHFTYALCKESFSCLKNNELILSEEAVKRLTDCCNDNELPCDEMLSSFLQEDGQSSMSSNRRQMRLTHEGARDFLASLFIWFELEKNTKSPGVDKFVENIVKMARDQGVDPATLDKIKAAIRKEFLSSKSPVEESTIIRDLLTEDGHIPLGSKYHNLLINLLGIICLLNRNGMESTKEEIINLLKESGVNCRDRWQDVLKRVNCDGFVLKCIAKVSGVMGKKRCN